ncbi:hypothetical protein [Erythrobacter sp.]|uniref:hypothetical protein n=1 Tax=Erythrobacter sp. TaxID=1042 RepID=UPI002EB8A690|nr:hypothetical protein [Erythrobacter sp.]
MNFPSLVRSILLAGTAVLLLDAPAASAQQQDTTLPDPATQDRAEGADDGGVAPAQIIVEGQRQRGRLDVEQAPLLELGEEDIAAEGVASIADLVTQITARTGSSRGRGGGGRPVILVNGIRPGSFRELFQYPPEALERVEVFPEEVALRFGFPPDRRVINLILKDNYRNAEVEFEFEGPARGGYHQREQELGYLQISDGARINFNLEANDTSLLTEDERGIVQTPGSVSDIAGDPDQAAFRSLVADSRGIEANVSYAKAFLESGTSISANANYDRSDRRSLQGLNTVFLTDDPLDPATGVLRTFGAETPLELRIASDTYAGSGSLSTRVNAFQFEATVDGNLNETETEIDRPFDTTALVEAALAGDLALDGALPSNADAGFDIANRRTIATTSLATLRGPIAYLPGGELTATFDAGLDWQRIESTDTRTAFDTQLTRRRAATGANFVIPITSRRNGFADALGSFTLNLQAGLEDLSDFGLLGDYTVGLVWAPFDNLDLTATYIEREVAPSLGALGDPQIVNLNTPVFDFTTGETVLATVTTGGNPDLLAETQRDWKFAANWELPFWDDARFQVEYVRNRSDDVVSAFPQVTPEIEAAFPDRITRDAGGRLIALDRRQVTFAEARADRLNFSLNVNGSIGGGEDRREGGGGGGPPQETRQSASPPPAQQSTDGRGGFMAFRERLCAEDGLAMLTRLANAIANGEDVSDIVPGFDPQRLAGMLGRVRGPDGEIDPARLAAVRERICAMGPPEAAEASGAPAAPGGPPTGPMGESFAAIRAIACAENGAERLRALITRIDAGEDVSDAIPGFDPNMAGFLIDRLRGEDGEIDPARIEALQERICSGEGGPPAGARGGEGGGGPPGGFNPLASGNRPGFRYFVSLNHTIELENQILIAPGLDPLDQLDGEATGAFGFPRNTTRLEAGIFGQGLGLRLSGRYTGPTRLEVSALAGSSGDLFFSDLATFDLRIFANIDELTGSDAEWLENVRISLRADNVFDGRIRVVDATGETPLNYQPFLVDPVGRFIGIDIRKLF